VSSLTSSEALLDKVESRTFFTTARSTKGTLDHVHGSIAQYPCADHLGKTPPRQLGQ